MIEENKVNKREYKPHRESGSYQLHYTSNSVTHKPQTGDSKEHEK
jgi:hypothetical protein